MQSDQDSEKKDSLGAKAPARVTISADRMTAYLTLDGPAEEYSEAEILRRHPAMLRGAR